MFAFPTTLFCVPIQRHTYINNLSHSNFTHFISSGEKFLRSEYDKLAIINHFSHCREANTKNEAVELVLNI